MNEQIPLNVDSGANKENAPARYEKTVGVKPLPGMTTAEMEAAISNPEDERARLRLLAMEEDREDIKRTYRR
ncbi:MAG TPA: hypothetical protein VFS75_02685 [Candidatus Paceibacterota bacterium]|nr:hypothetical protein [Candidatus Paceibacterota bacterium]